MDEQKVVNGNPSLCRLIKLVCKILEVILHVQDEFLKVPPSSHVCAENIRGDGNVGGFKSSGESNRGIT